ncbi:hypothetical protein GVAV_000455 [Gurleya vavrai]
MIGREANQFTAEAFENKQFTKINLKDYFGQNIVLVFYPFDFTFVCPTEILEFSEQKKAFEKLKAKVIFISCDSVYCHKKWTETEIIDGGIKGTSWPMVSDITRDICKNYDMLGDNYVAKRGTVIIGTDKLIKFINVMDDKIGRNVEEILRVLENLMLLSTNKNQKFCPVNYRIEKKSE